MRHNAMRDPAGICRQNGELVTSCQPRRIAAFTRWHRSRRSCTAHRAPRRSRIKCHSNCATRAWRKRCATAPRTDSRGLAGGVDMAFGVASARRRCSGEPATPRLETPLPRVNRNHFVAARPALRKTYRDHAVAHSRRRLRPLHVGRKDDDLAVPVGLLVFRKP